MPITHVEVSRHPLWREQVVATGALTDSPKRSSRVWWAVAVVGTIVLAGAIYLAVA